MRCHGAVLSGLAYAVLVRAVAAQPFGPELHVNSWTTDAQSYPSVAVDGTGDFVVVWQSNLQDGSGYGIFAQRYRFDGTPKGDEMPVNTTKAGDQKLPSIASTEDGRFLVVWQSANQDGSGLGVYMRRFDRSGAAGSEARVNTFTAGDQLSPSIALSPSGSGVVVWQSSGQDGSGLGVFGQRLAALAPAGKEFQVNVYTTNNQYNSKAAVDADGNFVVVWQSYGQDGSGAGVFGRRYASSGAAVGGEFQVNTTTLGYQRYPAVALAPNGNFAVVWVSFDGAGQGIWGQIYNPNGTRLGGEFRVNTTVANDQYEPAIGTDAKGDFVVAWFSYATDGSYGNILAQRLDATGAPIGGEFEVNSYTPFSQFAPAVSSGPGPNVVIAWSSNFQDGSSVGVYAKESALSSGDTRVNTSTAGDQKGPSVASDSSGNLVVVWQSDPQDGTVPTIRAQRFGSQGAPLGGEFRVDQSTTGAPQTPVVASSSAGEFVVAWSGVTNSGLGGPFNGILARRYDSGGNALTNAFTVFYGDSLETASSPAIASDAAGDFVVTWTHETGGSTNVFAQRYASSGSPLGLDFVVSSGLALSAGNPSVAMDAVGNFVIAYEAGGGYIAAQRYDSNGSQRGFQFLVSGLSIGIADGAPNVASDAIGNFVVAWQSGPSEDGSGYAVVGRLYDSSGALVGAPFQANFYTPGDQLAPRVAWVPPGFVVTWQSMGEDGSGDGVFWRRFSAAGVPHGGDFLANEFTPGVQAAPAVASAGGRFTVVWQGGGDGSGYGIWRRTFSILDGDVNADGVVDVSDVFYLNNYLFAGGPAPAGTADVDGSGVVDVADIFYLINYLFANGPAPQ
jgi:hypothetical protein